MATFTWAGGSVSGVLEIAAAASSARSRVVTHLILDGAAMFTARPAEPLASVVTAAFTGYADAAALRDAYRAGLRVSVAAAAGVGYLAETILTGTVRLVLDEDTAAVWRLTAEVSEVSA